MLAMAPQDASKKRIGERIPVPVSSHKDNITEIVIKARFHSYPDTMLIMQTNRYTGLQTDGIHEFGNNYYALIREYEEIAKTPKFSNKKYPLFFFVRRDLYQSKTTVDFLNNEEVRKEAAYIYEMNELRKKKWKEVLEEEYELYSLDSFWPISNGRIAGDKDVKFYCEFKIGETLSKVGKHHVLDIGAVLGNLPEINMMKNRLNRQLPYFNEHNKELQLRVELELPSNLQAGELSVLTSKLENVAGYFESKAHMEGRTLYWEITLAQSGFYHPAEEWPEYLRLTDEVAKLTKLKLLIE